MKFRTMKVEGQEIPAEVAETAASRFIASIKARGQAEFTTMQTAFIEAGADRTVAYRAADRLLQNMRRNGLIAYRGGRWVAA